MILTLELLRGLAALWVFLFHIKDQFSTSAPLIASFAAHGHSGVPMFFVISGYVIACSADSTIEKGRSAFSFLKNRFTRIYPAFWASVAVALIAPYLINLISALKSGVYVAPPHVLSSMSVSEWANFLLLTKVFLATSPDLQAQFNIVNAVYWSLAIEFQFYIVVTIALLTGRRYKPVFVAVTLASLILMFVPARINYGLFIHYWPMFAIGLGVRYLMCSRAFSSLPTFRMSWLYAFGAVVAGTVFHRFPQYLTHPLTFPACFASLLLLFSRAEPILVRMKKSRNRLMQYLIQPWLTLGTMSYSVYLLHGALFTIPTMFVTQVVARQNILSPILTVLGTLMLCYVFYWVVERRFLSSNYKKIHLEAMMGAESGIKPSDDIKTAG